MPSKRAAASGGAASPSSPTRRSVALQPGRAEPDAAATEALATRIIEHMNADHADSLLRYLQFYGRVWAISARVPLMEKITRNDMTIASSGPFGAPEARGLRTTIRFEPPLAAGLSDARQRLIEMDDEARRGLGRAPETVRRYQGPTAAWEWAWWVFVAGAWGLFSRPANLRDGSFVLTRLLGWAPAEFVAFLRLWQPKIMMIMLGLHALETAEMALGKMRKHSVEMWSHVWWAWVLSVAFEGFPVWARLERVVEEEREKMEKTKH